MPPKASRKSKPSTIAPPRPRARPSNTATTSTVRTNKAAAQPLRPPTTTASSSTKRTKTPSKPLSSRPPPTASRSTAPSARASTSYAAAADTTVATDPSDTDDSQLSLVTGLSASDTDTDTSDALSVVSESTLSSAASLSASDASSSSRVGAKRKARRAWPTAKQRLAKWRRLTLSEREALTSEGGLVWREARTLLAPLSRGVRAVVAAEVAALLARVERRLETGLVPPLLKLPGTAVGAAAAWAGPGRRDVASSLLSWRIEVERDELVRQQALGRHPAATTLPLGMEAEITELEHQLLPEAEQAVDLTHTLRDQQRALGESISRIQQLKRERKRWKPARGTTAIRAGGQDADADATATAAAPDADAPPPPTARGGTVKISDLIRSVQDGSGLDRTLSAYL